MKPPLPTDVFAAELAAAEAEIAPARLTALDATYTLRAAECLEIGAALAGLAEAHYEAHSREVGAEDRLEAFQRHAAALQVAGGAKWVLEIGGGECLERGDSGLDLATASDFLGGWQERGDARLLEPVEIVVFWPAAAARVVALELAEEALRRGAAALEGELTARAVLEKARALVQASPGDDASFAALVEELRPRAEELADRATAAEEAARRVVRDAPLNRAAYLTTMASLAVDALRAALEYAPELSTIVHHRVELGYAETGLAQRVEQYYPREDAEYDEILTIDREREQRTACRVIARLIEAVLEDARR